jgi:hypothetical protein
VTIRPGSRGAPTRKEGVMDRHDLRDLLVEGLDVYGADGSKLGSIIALAPDRIVVEKGFFFPTD